MVSFFESMRFSSFVLGRMKNPFADPQLEAKLLMNPKTRGYLNDPTFMHQLNLLKQDASNLNL